jgi:DNA polymerase-3 subunit epsilon
MLAEDLCLTYVDVETTGLQAASGDRVCEIALLRVQGEREVARFESLVQPQRPMGAGAMAVNGITDSMLVGAPSFAALLPRVQALLQDAVLVAHNARFDVGFLRHEWRVAGQTFPEMAAVDTLALAQARYRFRHNSLAAIAAELGVLHLPTHRAMTDVLATRQVLQRFLADMRQEGPVTLAHLIYPGNRRPGAEIVAMMAVLQEAMPAGKRLHLRYQAGNAPETVREVQPLEVYYEHGCGYLRAFCYLRQSERHFRFDRIAELRMVREG